MRTILGLAVGAAAIMVGCRTNHQPVVWELPPAEPVWIESQPHVFYRGLDTFVSTRIVGEQGNIDPDPERLWESCLTITYRGRELRLFRRERLPRPEGALDAEKTYRFRVAPFFSLEGDRPAGILCQVQDLGGKVVWPPVPEREP